MIYQGTILIIDFSVGILIGSFYFYGLWWTVRNLPRVQNKMLWLTGSFLIRMSAALAGFYLVMGGRWERLLICLLGFVLMRIIFSRCLRPVSPTGTGGQSAKQCLDTSSIQHL